MQFEDSIPEVEERQKFGEATYKECRNASYHIYSIMYEI